MLIFQKNFCIIEKDKKVERNAIMNLEEIRTEIDALDNGTASHCLNGVWIFAEMSPFIRKNTTSQFSSRNGKKSCWTRSNRQPPQQTANMLHARCSLCHLRHQQAAAIPYLSQNGNRPQFPRSRIFLLPRKSAVRERMVQTPKRLLSSSFPTELSLSTPLLNMSFRQ